VSSSRRRVSATFMRKKSVLRPMSSAPSSPRRPLVLTTEMPSSGMPEIRMTARQPSTPERLKPSQLQAEKDAGLHSYHKQSPTNPEVLSSQPATTRQSSFARRASVDLPGLRLFRRRSTTVSMSASPKSNIGQPTRNAHKRSSVGATSVASATASEVDDHGLAEVAGANLGFSAQSKGLDKVRERLSMQPTKRRWRHNAVDSQV
jgi:hypothetical protein